MQKRVTVISCLSALLLITAFAVACRAATVTIATAGSGVYELRGSDFSSVAGLDLQISYDSASLAGPTIARGSLVTGALMDSNTSIAGRIRIAVITTRPISGTGVIATITFRLTGSSPGRIQSMAASLIDKNGARLNSQIQIINPADTGQTDTGTSSGNAASTDAASSSPRAEGASESPAAVTGAETVSGQSAQATSSPSGTVMGQTVALPEVENPSVAGGREGKPAPSPMPEMMTGAEVQGMSPGMPAMPPGDVPVQGMPAASPQSVSAQGAARFLPAVVSVLERFRGYRGTRTIEAYTALFDQPANTGSRQEPAVVLSDGSSTARLILSRSGSGSAAPNFAFAGVRLVSIKRGAGNSWVVEVRPDKGVNQATVTALVDNMATKYPITVAQPLEMAGGAAGLKATEKDFAVFLKQRGSANAPLYDLNRDGTRDYLDDYIFTANYLAATRKVKHGKASVAK